MAKRVIKQVAEVSDEGLPATDVATTIYLEPPSPTNVLIYEYGARVDPECQAMFHDQAFKAHTLYNKIVAFMHETVAQVQQVLLASAGDRAGELDALVSALDADFKEARARNDESAMKDVAIRRRAARQELWQLLAQARKRVKEELKPIYARVGRNAACGTYQLRSEAVAEGLGWATANATLDAALSAWKKTIAKGQAPRFAKFGEKTQLTLTLQFTAAGGIAGDHLLAGRHMELVLDPKGAAGRRQYGDFLFRVGPAKDQSFIRGTWQYHRPIPEGAHVGLARLVGRKHGPRWKFALQFMVKAKDPVAITLQRKNPDDLVAVHLGWSADDAGRRIAGIAFGPDPGSASLLKLPADIEADLAHSREIESRRDTLRDEVVTALKQIDPAAVGDELSEELQRIRRTKTEHVAQRRLHGLLRRFAEDVSAAPVVGHLQPWVEVDRKLHIAMDGISKRARNRRWNTYQEYALQIVRGAKMVALSHLDLATAAQKIDEDTGERSEFTAAARRGRTDAAVSELVSAIKWVCNKTSTPLVLVEGEETASTCPYCAGKLVRNAEDWQISDCTACGAQTDRKMGAAARIYQLVAPRREEFEQAFIQSQMDAWAEHSSAQEERKEKMAQGRRDARAKRSADAQEVREDETA